MVKASAKKRDIPTSYADKNKFNMKIVTTENCFICKQQCDRGIRYMQMMVRPGAVGRGIPCILTKGKAYK